MKPHLARHSGAVALAAVLSFAAGMASAGDTVKSDSKTVRKQLRPAKPTPVAVQGKLSKRLLTGSHIPTDARRMGTTADTPYPIYIIGGKEIARSGAGSITEALKRCPAVR